METEQHSIAKYRVERPIRVAFGGKARSGKSTATAALRKFCGGTEFAFSDPMYEILHFAQDKLGFPRGKDRDFLQMLGKWARRKDPDVFVRYLQDQLSSAIYKCAWKCSNANLFVSDIRFPNEFKALRNFHVVKENPTERFMLIRICRDADVDIGGGSKDDVSETSVNDIPDREWDLVITNNGTLEEFERNVIDAVEAFYSR